MKASIIVPAYNTGEKITGCIESILRQTERDFELIIIDDGSTDNTAAILEKYKVADRRVVIISKANGGVSSARNCGLSNARGDYIVFVDSDDYVPLDMLEKLESALLRHNSDLVMGKMYHVEMGTGKVREHKLESPLLECATNPNIPDKFKKIITGYALHRGVAYSNLAKIYKGDIIRKFHIRFDETKSYCEDVLFNISYFRHISTVDVEDYYYYYALDNENSLTKHYDEKFPSITEEVYSEFISLFSDMGFMDEYLETSMGIQLLKSMWDLVFRLLSGKYAEVSEADRITLSVNILEMQVVRELMGKYRKKYNVCGDSMIGKIAALCYCNGHERVTVHAIKGFVILREKIRIGSRDKSL